MSPSNCATIVFIGSISLFLVFSSLLVPYNFDLHHDGYTLTQSWQAAKNSPLAGETYFQYGILYHYVLGGLLLLGDGSPILSRYVAIALVLSSVAILLNSSVSHRLPVAMALGLWSLQLLVRAVFTIFRSVPSQSNRASAVFRGSVRSAARYTDRAADEHSAHPADLVCHSVPVREDKLRHSIGFGYNPVALRDARFTGVRHLLHHRHLFDGQFFLRPAFAFGRPCCHRGA